MKIFDLHCDTITELSGHGKERHLAENDMHIDIEKLKKGDSLAQCFAVFVHQKACEKAGISPFDFYREKVEVFRRELSENSASIRQAVTVSDILENEKAGLISGILTVEGGETLCGDLSRLDELKNDGVRMMTLTWNFENEIGFSHKTGGHLKPFGKEVVERMNELSMRVDVSHLSDEGFYDVMDILKDRYPVVASHSCARALCRNTRDLTDDMLKKIGENGGIAGINYYSCFLRDDAEHSTYEDVLKHAVHMVNKAGIESVALGSDYDGIDCTLDWTDYSGMPLLVEYLHKEFTYDQLEKICFKNALRVFA